MRKILFTFIVVGFTAISFGQKTEFGVSINSGLFSFSGKSAQSISFINYNDDLKSGYTNNPYGSKSGLSGGISANIKRVSNRNFIVGADFGYELLRSKTNINNIVINSGIVSYNYTATGNTYINYSFLNLNPFVGYRISFDQVSFDITGGLDVGYCLKATEKSKITASNEIKYTTTVDRSTIKNDFRPRIQVTTNFSNLGIYVGYSLGVLNYMKGYVGGVNDATSRVLRFGLGYRLY